MGENGNGRIRVDPTLLLQVVAWLIVAVATYGAISSRVAVVETKQSETDRRLERIEQKLDDLLRLAR